MRTLSRRPERVALGSVFIGVALVLAKLVVGLLTGSLGILSEAVHSIFDLAASTFTLVAVRTARKPPDKEHPYGHGRAENLAAFANGLLLLITAAGIAFEAVRRLIAGGAHVNPAGYAFALLIGTLLIESGRAFVLRRVGRLASSDAMLADATDRVADVLATVGVLITATLTAPVSSNARRTDSAPAMVPNICMTRSERVSPSRFSAGITSASPVVASKSA